MEVYTSPKLQTLLSYLQVTHLVLLHAQVVISRSLLYVLNVLAATFCSNMRVTALALIIHVEYKMRP
jgi:hypothetical protein